MENFSTKTEYLNALKERCLLPQGFSAAALSFPFIPVEHPQGGTRDMSLALIRLDQPTERFAGVFTRNRFPGAPVILGKKRLGEESTRGVLINNRVANVCAPGGGEAAEELCTDLGLLTGDTGESYFASSTGVIGWRLPFEAMKAALPGLVDRLEVNRRNEKEAPGEALLEVAQGIMTTDSFPKVRAISVGEGRIVAVAKGAGMIEPNMGTMLCFVLTDLGISQTTLRRTLAGVTDRSFNTISIDGDQSTSDMVLAFSSGLCPPVEEGAFAAALEEVLRDLSEDLVRNGEGTGHVIRLTLTGAPNDEIAREAGKGVINSPLVKTAVAGNDPNVGRILSSLGDYGGNNDIDLDPARISLSLGEHRVYWNGRFELDRETEALLSAYLKGAQLPAKSQGYPVHRRTVDITLDLGMGPGRAEVLGSDLTCEYVMENADYRT